MKIKSLKLVNFRNWSSYDLEFNDVTILIGKNGIGKTNILESVYLAATGRSWRTTHDMELINWEKDYARLTIKGDKTDKATELELFWQKGEKAVKALKINGGKRRLLDLLGLCPAVLFSPEVIEIINGAPALRRRFLDILLSQVNRAHAESLLEYNKVLKGRNKLLQLIKNRLGKSDELDFWDKKLVELGGKIIKARHEALEFFNQTLSANYQKISGAQEDLKIKYKDSVEIDRFAEYLVAARDREIEQTNTLHGPHRDDFEFRLGERDVATFGSRGEFRSVVLALKLAELNFIKEKTKISPILLLDDIFSELDATRRKHLALIAQDQQTLITTTDLDHIGKDLREKAKIIEL